MPTITVEVEEKLFEDMQEKGFDVQAEFNNFLSDLVEDDGYPAISTEEAKKIISEEIDDYLENGMKNCGVIDDEFWRDTEARLLERHKQVS